MIWDIFRPVDSRSYPHNPGEYLGSINLPEKRVDGIDRNMMEFDLYLRQANLKAYGKDYKLVQSRKQYTGFMLKSKDSVLLQRPSLQEQMKSSHNARSSSSPEHNKTSYMER